MGEHQEHLDDGLNMEALCSHIIIITQEVQEGRHSCRDKGVRASFLVELLFKVALEVLRVLRADLVRLHEIEIEHHAPGVKLELVLGGFLILGYHDILKACTG